MDVQVERRLWSLVAAALRATAPAGSSPARTECAPWQGAVREPAASSELRRGLDADQLAADVQLRLALPIARGRDRLRGVPEVLLAGQQAESAGTLADVELLTEEIGRVRKEAWKAIPQRFGSMACVLMGLSRSLDCVPHAETGQCSQPKRVGLPATGRRRRRHAGRHAVVRPKCCRVRSAAPPGRPDSPRTGRRRGDVAGCPQVRTGRRGRGSLRVPAQVRRSTMVRAMTCVDLVMSASRQCSSGWWACSSCPGPQATHWPMPPMRWKCLWS